MPTEQEEKNYLSRTTAFERHGQSVVVSILLAVALWIGYTVNQNSKVGAELKVEVASLRDVIVLQMSDRYLGTQGAALERRVDIIEEQIRTHMSEHYNSKN